MKKVWDGEALQKFIDASGITAQEFAAEIGVKRATLQSQLDGRSAPNFTTLCRYADFFEVSLDEISGRVDTSGAMEYYNGEHKELIEAIKKRYVKKLEKKGISEAADEENAVSWPYNLLQDVYEGRDVPEIRMDGFEHVLNSLGKKERDMVYRHYREGDTLHEIGKDYGVTRERARQVIARALKRMRHFSALAYLELGVENAEKIDEQREMKDALVKKYLDIKEKERFLDLIEGKIAEREEIAAGVITDHIVPGNADIGCLNLSTRANNWVRRGFRENGKLREVKTVSDLAEIAEEGRLRNIRNIGTKTVREICAALYLYTGKDYRVANRVG